MNFTLGMIGAGAVLAGVGLAFTFQSPAGTTVQRGYRGVGQEVNYHDATVAKQRAANVVPAPEPAQDPAGTTAAKSGAYQNVKVLGNVDSNEFLRLMSAVTNWVAPTQGCTYCHSAENLAYDTVYTKIVARRMMQMTQHINADWKNHVGATGVTCYTCHRGNPVPANIWFNEGPTAPNQMGGMTEANIGKNLVSKAAALASLPSDPYTPFLEQNNEIRVVAHQALPGTDNSSIKQTDWTYALMMHFSNALGVNCTYCHNSRAFYDWDQSSPQRVTAWYGIRMVRDLNTNFLDPLGKNGTFPAGRLGVMGDAAKINCTTCHQGVYKPLFGQSMVKDYPEIGADGQVDIAADVGKVGDFQPKQ